MQLNINVIQTATVIPDCMTKQELQQATSQDEHLKHLQEHHRDQIPQDMRTYMMFHDDMAVIDGVILKGRCVVIPEA